MKIQKNNFLVLRLKIRTYKSLRYEYYNCFEKLIENIRILNVPKQCFCRQNVYKFVKYYTMEEQGSSLCLF